MSLFLTCNAQAGPVANKRTSSDLLSQATQYHEFQPQQQQMIPQWYVRAMDVVDRMLCCSYSGEQLHAEQAINLDDLKYRAEHCDADLNSITYFDDDILLDDDSYRHGAEIFSRFANHDHGKMRTPSVVVPPPSPEYSRHLARTEKMKNSQQRFSFMDNNPYKSSPIRLPAYTVSSTRAPRRDSCSTETTASMNSASTYPEELQSFGSIQTAQTFDESYVSSTATTAFMQNASTVVGRKDGVEITVKKNSRRQSRGDAATKRGSLQKENRTMDQDYDLARTTTDPSMAEKELLRHYSESSEGPAVFANCE